MSEENEVNPSPMMRDTRTPEQKRIADLEKPSPEERVTIVRWLHDPSRWIVLRDGWNPGNHDGFKDRKDAERYAAGLRLELAALVKRREGK